MSHYNLYKHLLYILKSEFIYTKKVQKHLLSVQYWTFQKLQMIAFHIKWLKRATWLKKLLSLSLINDLKWSFGPFFFTLNGYTTLQVNICVIWGTVFDTSNESWPTIKAIIINISERLQTRPLWLMWRASDSICLDQSALSSETGHVGSYQWREQIP